MKEVQPTFARPPVVEQAITLMFDPIESFSIGDIGLFWQRIYAEFPECIAQERLGQALEMLGQPLPFRLELTQGVETPRALFRNSQKGELAQVQSDRFSFNWMQVEGAEYPRHDATMARFWGLFEKFCAHLVERGLAPPKLIQCELINVNIVPLVEFGGTFERALSAFKVSIPTISSVDNLPSEGARFNTHHLFLDDQGAPIGRIHTDLHSVQNLSSQQEAIRFDITARGALSPLDASRAKEFFGVARSAINATFLAYTSDDARRHWGEQQ